MRRALLLVALAWTLAACGRSSPPASSGAAGPAAAAEPSLFELSFPLTDASARVRHLDEFRGTPFVATMIYTQCTSVCPRVTADLQRLDRALPAGVRDRTRYVLLSLDPERDTPEAMTRFVHDHGLDATRWTLLAAEPDDMRTLAAVLGVKFRPDAGGEIAHSAVFAVVDAGGVVRHRQTGTKDDLDELVAAVTEVATAAPGSQR